MHLEAQAVQRGVRRQPAPGRTVDERRLEPAGVTHRPYDVRRAERPVVDQDRLAGRPDRRARGQPQVVDGDRLRAGDPQPVDQSLQVAVQHPARPDLAAARHRQGPRLLGGAVVKDGHDAGPGHRDHPGGQLEPAQRGGGIAREGRVAAGGDLFAQGRNLPGQRVGLGRASLHLLHQAVATGAPGATHRRGGRTGEQADDDDDGRTAQSVP